jgi:copper chaperone CopZ
MELGDIAGVHSIEVDVPTKKVTVEYEPPADKQQIVDLLTEINYPPESVS